MEEEKKVLADTIKYEIKLSSLSEKKLNLELEASRILDEIDRTEEELNILDKGLVTNDNKESILNLHKKLEKSLNDIIIIKLFNNEKLEINISTIRKAPFFGHLIVGYIIFIRDLFDFGNKLFKEQFKCKMKTNIQYLLHMIS